MPYGASLNGRIHLYSALRDHMAAQVDQRLDGKNPATALAMYSARVFPAGPFTRNAGFWAADIAQSLTAMSPSNSASGSGQAPVTLITPRHTIAAAHADPADGSTIYFVDAANNVISRTQTAHADVAGNDLVVGLLDSDLPAAISPLKVIPDDFYTWFLIYAPTPTLCSDQDANGVVRDIAVLQRRLIRLTIPTLADRIPFYQVGALGDSGSALNVLINNEIVLCGIQSQVQLPNDTFGPTPYLANDAINTAIVAADIAGGIAPTGYTVTNPNLSIFTVAN